MPTIAEALSLAFQHHQAGRLPEAETLYRQILQVQPDHPDALHLLGVIAHQVGQHDLAVRYISQAIASDRPRAEFHNNIGEAYRAQGKLEEAVGHYRQALALNPAYAEAYNNLGTVLREQGKLEDAAAHYRQALALKPGYTEACNNLGNALKEQGELEEAVAYYKQALALSPAFAEAYNNLGSALKEQGKLGEAVVQYKRALTLKPIFAEAYNNLGAVFLEQGQLEEAVAHYQQALALKPGYAEASYNLGNLWREQGKLEEAVGHYRRALALKPGHTEAYNNLGITLQEQGKLAEAIDCFRQALKIAPECVGAHSNLLLCMNYHPAYDSATIFEHHRQWNDQHARNLAPQSMPCFIGHKTARQLRIGYVSADFKRHPVGAFLEAVLSCHDKSQFRIYCYSGVVKADDVTLRIQAQADEWRNIAAICDEDVARSIRNDAIDILVDLSGHTAGNRLLVFARKPAPVQAAWIGYINTTGLDTMDYLIADNYVSPPDRAQQFTEELVRLPQNYLCVCPPQDAPPVLHCPALAKGYITFGCFNNLSKVNADAIGLWSKILGAAPNSRLILKNKSFNDTKTRETYRKLFMKSEITPGRVDLLGSSPHAELLAHYGQVDIALDTFPYTGGLTTLEALWMGVPVVTLAGTQFVSRVGMSLLSNVGLPELIAQSPEHYVELALQLSQDSDRRAGLRESLRARMAASPLCDAATFTRNLERAYRAMWRTWRGQAGK